MTPEEIDAIATTAAERAVKSTLLSLGINIETPEAVVEAQLDFQHLRAWRGVDRGSEAQGAADGRHCRGDGSARLSGARLPQQRDAFSATWQCALTNRDRSAIVG